jgi:hypothetical protein
MFSVDDDAPSSNPLVNPVLGKNPSCVDAPSLHDIVMGRPAAGILYLGLLVEARACWKRTKLKRYESCTTTQVTIGGKVLAYYYHAYGVSCMAECIMVSQLLDPQDLDRGVDPDVDHGLTHHSSVMVHVDPPPPPEPPPCIHHPPYCHIDLVNQEPSPRSVKIEMMPVVWYFNVWPFIVKIASTLVTVDFYAVDSYTHCCDTSFVSSFPGCILFGTRI